MKRMEPDAPQPKKITPPPGDPLIVHVSHRAMATQFVVLLPAHQSNRVEAVVEALEMLDEIEARLTVYSDESEVSRINGTADHQWVKVSRPTFKLIERAVHWSQATSGAFDITAGPLIEAWGFTSRSGRKPTTREIERARQRVGYEKLELNDEQPSVRFATKEMSINLGAIGKGAALDQLKCHLLHLGVCDFLIHGGASSVIACGNQYPNSQGGWAVGIAHPTKPKRRLGAIWMQNTALATSGSGKQFFHHQGKRYGHVIDPRSGHPSSEFASLTILTSSATDADAAATGLYVGGAKMIENFKPSPPSSPLQWIAVRQGDRQDEMIVSSSDGIIWVDDGQESPSQ